MGFNFISAAASLVEIVPQLAQWLVGTKKESIASQAIHMARRVTGAMDIEDILMALKGDPELLTIFKNEMRDLSLEWEKAYQADRANARLRDLERARIGSSTVRADLMVATAALGLIGSMLALVFLKQTVSGEVVGLLSAISGILGSCLKDAFAFEFGSTRRRKRKGANWLSFMKS